MAKKWYIQWIISESKKKLIDELLGLGIFEIGEFELKHHEKKPTVLKSPFKINLRTGEQGGPLIPDAIKAIAAEMFELIKKKRLKFDLVVGVPRAGEPFAKIISQLSNKPLLKLKKEVLGNKRRITNVCEGEFSPGQIVLVIDDVITWGDSKREAIVALEKVGLRVSDLIVGVDRMQGGIEELEKSGWQVHYIFSLIIILSRCFAIGRISQQKYDEILAYIETSKVAH